jgi:hypothetical protein
MSYRNQTNTLLRLHQSKPNYLAHCNPFLTVMYTVVHVILSKTIFVVITDYITITQLIVITLCVSTVTVHARYYVWKLGEMLSLREIVASEAIMNKQLLEKLTCMRGAS